MFSALTARAASAARKPAGSAVAPAPAAPARAARGRGFDLSRVPVQAKRVVNEPGDVYEQEADRVADAVTSGRPAFGAGAPPITPLARGIQAKCRECEDEVIQRRPAEDEHPGTATPPTGTTYVAVIGGLSDKTIEKGPVDKVLLPELKKTYGERAQYFQWYQGAAAAAWITGLHQADPSAQFVVIGHSYGGDEALQVAKRLEGEQVQISQLITLDPVSMIEPDRSNNISDWANIYVNDRAFGSSDKWAILGGGWDEREDADVNIPANSGGYKGVHHSHALEMYNRVLDELKKRDAAKPPRGLDGKPLQRKATREGATPADASGVEAVLRSEGSPLDRATRAELEPRFGRDLSGVRVHTDATAAESARSLNARAYTVGHDIAFGAGQYAPGTTAGRHLLAHELTHVVQQSRGGLVVGGAGAPPAVQRDLLPSWEDVKKKVPTRDDLRKGAEAVKAAPGQAWDYSSKKAGEAGAYVADKARGAVKTLAEFREKVCTSPGECIGKLWLSLSYEQKVEVIDWMVGGAAAVVEKVPSRGLGFLWPLIRAALIGFFQQLTTAKPEAKVAAMDKVATIIAGKSEAYNQAFLVGFLKGFFYDGLLGPAVAVKELIGALPEVWKLIQRVADAIGGFPDEIQALVAEFRQFGSELLKQVEPAIAELTALANDPARASAALQSLAAQAEKLAAEGGGKLAKLFLNFLSEQGADAAIGDAVGRGLGQATFEVVAAILTGGASGGAAAGKKALREAAGYLGKLAGRVSGEFVRLFREAEALFTSGVKHVKDFVALLKQKALNALGAVGERFAGLIEKVKGFFAKLGKSCTNSKFRCDPPVSKGADPHHASKRKEAAPTTPGRQPGDGPQQTHTPGVPHADLPAERKYNPNPKHEEKGTRGVKENPLDISAKEAEAMLKDPERTLQVPGQRQIIAVDNGKIYVFKDDNAGGYHAHLYADGAKFLQHYKWASKWVLRKLGTTAKRLSRQ